LKKVILFKEVLESEGKGFPKVYVEEFETIAEMENELGL
jgi:hypothetical protein